MAFICKANDEQKLWLCVLSGEVDLFCVPEVKESLNSMLDEHAWSVEMDLADMSYIDSAGIGMLIGALKRVCSFGGSIVLKNVRPEIQNIFNITKLNKVFEIR